jgi:hypothetical protein
MLEDSVDAQKEKRKRTLDEWEEESRDRSKGMCSAFAPSYQPTQTRCEQSVADQWHKDDWTAKNSQLIHSSSIELLP